MPGQRVLKFGCGSPKLPSLLLPNFLLAHQRTDLHVFISFPEDPLLEQPKWGHSETPPLPLGLDGAPNSG